MLPSFIYSLLRGGRLRRVIDRATAALNVGDFRLALDLLAPAYREAPANARVLTLLARALIEAGNVAQGVELLEKALSLVPHFADARVLLARQLQYAGRIDVALEHLRTALEFTPDAPQVHRAILRPLMETCDWQEVERRRDALLQLIDAGKAWTDYAAPIDVLLLGMSGAVRRASAQARAAEIRRNERPKATIGKHGKLHPGDRLRIGYLSGDFRDHAVTHLAGNLFRRHDRNRFDVYAFSYGRDDGSSYRRQVMTDADHFIDVRGKANVDIARLVHSCGIHILIDLGGHTDSSRLGILAHRPAPVQAHYLGYPATTGADFVDYFLADRIVAPTTLDAEFTERFVRLPGCFMVSDESIVTNAPALRADHNLPDKGFVFVSFNQNSRIDPSIWQVWTEILGAVPGSVLWLKHHNDLGCERLRAAAAAKGIDPRRIVFAPDLHEKGAHIARLQLADLGLDTFGRYNGHTSTADALWAGVPVVTTASDCFPGRVAASLLTASGMADCVVDDVEAYKAFAIRYATDVATQRRLRSQLRSAQRDTPFFRPASVVRALERAYSAMWERHESGRAPAPIDLSDE